MKSPYDLAQLDMNKALDMAIILETLYPDLFKQAEELIQDGRTGTDLLSLLRSKMPLDTAAQYRKALMMVLQEDWKPA